MKLCKKCGKEIDDKAVMCVHCGCSAKEKKPIFKKWWFWLVIVIVVIAIVVATSGGGNTDSASNSNESQTSTAQNADNKKDKISYESIELQKMVDDLESNAMRAEETYQNKYVKIKAEISSIDSDGGYISVRPTTDEFSLISVICYIKNDEQKKKIMEKSTGDTITIKGKVKSVGELLGYSIDIDEIVS